MVAVGDTAALIQYVNSQAPAYGLDPAAVLAVARVEGWGGTVGDGGHAYGPWQDHLTDFKGRPWYGSGINNATVQTWAWSSDGINYVLDQMATTGKAQGKSGYLAVNDIVTFYERSSDVPGEIKNAFDNWYHSFANGSAVGTNGTVSTDDPTLSSGAALVSGQSASSASTTTSASGGSQFTLIPGVSGPGFDWPGVKISTGFLWAAGFFILAGLLIIAGLIFAFRKQIAQGIETAGKVAAVAA